MGVSSARAKASESDTRCHENVVYLRGSGRALDLLRGETPDAHLSLLRTK